MKQGQRKYGVVTLPSECWERKLACIASAVGETDTHGNNVCLVDTLDPEMTDVDFSVVVHDLTEMRS